MVINYPLDIPFSQWNQCIQNNASGRKITCFTRDNAEMNLVLLDGLLYSIVLFLSFLVHMTLGNTIRGSLVPLLKPYSPIFYL